MSIFSSNIIDIPDEIIGVTDYPDGELKFLCKFKGDVAILVEAKVAHTMFPQLVINFFEERITFTET